MKIRQQNELLALVKRGGIIAMIFETARIHVFVAVAVITAQAPYFL